MDNFNWGVRRQSLSRLEGTEEAGEVSFVYYFFGQLFVYKKKIGFTKLSISGQFIFGYEQPLWHDSNIVQKGISRWCWSRRILRWWNGIGNYYEYFSVYRFDVKIKKLYFFFCSKHLPEVMKTTVELHPLIQLLLLWCILQMLWNPEGMYTLFTYVSC